MASLTADGAAHPDTQLNIMNFRVHRSRWPSTPTDGLWQETNSSSTWTSALETCRLKHSWHWVRQ